MAALAGAIAPRSLQLTYCAGNALPFRVEWQAPRGQVMFFGLTPDHAAAEALAALERGTAERPAASLPLTEPSGDSDWAEAMRGLIADIDAERKESRRRPFLRVVRGGAS